jgi:hypothetical protein
LSIIRRLHVPLREPADVIPHLGAAHHWKEGRSAKSLVDQWWQANELPSTVSRLLDQAPEWRRAGLIDAFVERCTSLQDGRPSHSQSDLLAVVGVGDRIGIVGIEAKMDEGFDRTVREWLGDGNAGKRTRLTKLCDLLMLDPGLVGHLRYQLFHRTASCILEAGRYRARQAAMIVQSWSAQSDGFEDFAAFVEALGLERPKMDVLTAAIMLADVDLRFGWSAEIAAR